MHITNRPGSTHAVGDDLGTRGYAVIDDVFGAERALALRAEVQGFHERGCFVRARVGHRDRRQLAPLVRSDEICWLDPDAGQNARDGAHGVRPHKFTRGFLAALETLRLELNRSLYLGLRRVECHAARYDAGAYYRPHIDAFLGDSARVVSFVYFLNPEWTAAHGGVLRLHTEPGFDVEPRMDRLALFLSRDVLHEVMDVHHERWTLTGWFAVDHPGT